MRSSWHHMDPTSERDLALRRVRSIFRWTVAGAFGAAGLLVGVVAHEIPGRSSTTSASSGAAGTNSAPGSSPSSSPDSGTGTGSSPGFVAPSPAPTSVSPSPTVPAPAPTQRAPAAVSGGTSF